MRNRKEKESSVVVGGSRRPFFVGRKNRLILLSILLALLLAGGGVLLKRHQGDLRKPVCSDATLQAAAPVLDRSKKTKLKLIAENIQKLRGFEHDPNCLYVVVTYDINNGDLPNARLYFNKLKKLYDPNKGFNPYLGSNLKNIATFEEDVKFLEVRDEAIKNNIVTFPNE